MNVLGIDWGGSHVTSIVLNERASVLQRHSLPINDCSRTIVIDTIVSCARALTEPFEAVGIAVPGNVDPSSGIARYLPSFQWGEQLDIRGLLQAVFAMPLDMRNDGRCAALAESCFGAGRNRTLFAMLTLGTGIGGGLIHHGKLFEGCSFDAGDFGHHAIRSGPEAFDCLCGKRGCFEAHASALGLVRHYDRQGGIAKNSKQVMIAVRAGERAARVAFDNYKDDLSTGVANLITFYNPEKIALGGGLSQAPEIFEELQVLVDEKTLPATRGKARIVPSMLGPDAGAIGAAILVLPAYRGIASIV